MTPTPTPPPPVTVVRIWATPTCGHCHALMASTHAKPILFKPRRGEVKPAAFPLVQYSDGVCDHAERVYSGAAVFGASYYETIITARY